MVKARKVKRVALYARLSVSTEESVSIERQLQAGRDLAAARGWTVVAEFVDDSVSATKVKPEQRAGWKALMGHKERFDAVIVWKVDRLARRVLDFLHADEALNKRGAALVAVEDPIDMTTAPGRGFAVMLAVFGEMEAAATSDRVRAARHAILKAGRRAGGRPPYGWMNVANPDGPGQVLAQDPERIDVVRTMVDMVLSGSSIYRVSKWLDEEGIKPRVREGAAGVWHDASIEAILRNPVLAGMVPFGPGRTPKDDPDPTALLRDESGIAIVDESIAILGTDERRRLLAVLDEAKRPTGRRRGDLVPLLLDGLGRCASCGSPLHRATAAKSYLAYRCNNKLCNVRANVLRGPLEAAVETRFLEHKGDDLTVDLAEVVSDFSDRLGDIEEAIQSIAGELAGDDADELDLLRRLRDLKAMREEVRAQTDGPAARSWTYGKRTNRDAWNAGSVEERNRLLRSALTAVRVKPAGKRGQRFDTGRIEYDWLILPEAAEIAVRTLRGEPFRARER